MESRAFRICPFCQTPSPASTPRCLRCQRSLAGLPLPVYGSDLDAALARPAAEPLVDLPLREAPPAPVPAVAPHAVGAGPRPRPAAARRRTGPAAKWSVGAAMMGGIVVGAWLVRAQDRERPREATRRPTAVATVAPATTLASAPRPSAAPVTRRVSAAMPRARSAVPSRAADDSEGRRAHPDVRAAPVGVERARGDLRGESASTGDDLDRGAALRGRLRRAEARRQRAAERAAELRARTNVPVVRDVEGYQRLQDELAAALEELDRADAAVARLRRALEPRE